MSDALRESYDRVAGAYAAHLFDELAGKPLDRHLLNRFAEGVRGRGRVCDVGCGPGQVARYLHEQGVPACGLDLAPGMLEQARVRNPPAIPWLAGDLRALPFADATLAGISAFYSLIHLAPAERAPALRELHRALAPGGLLLVAFHVGDDVVHRDLLWGQPVCLDFAFLQPRDVTQQTTAAGFEVLEVSERAPYPEVEHPSRRCYMLSRKPPVE
jgi:SAM-dependent methyltransferase